MIEKGQYLNLNRDERLCPFCPSTIIEDEIHLLFICPLYKHLRNDFFSYMSIQCQLELTHLSITDKIAAVFQQNNSKINFLLGTFVSKYLEYRDEHKSNKQIIKYCNLAFDKFAIILLYTTTTNDRKFCILLFVNVCCLMFLFNTDFM